MEYTQEQNRALCEAYPFLDRNRRWGAKGCPDGPKPGVPEDLKEWDYEYTELDCMPDGWRSRSNAVWMLPSREWCWYQHALLQGSRPSWMRLQAMVIPWCSL